MNLKDWAGKLIWATILVTVVRYSAAFAASDTGQITGIWSEVVTGALTLTGIGMGLLDTLGGGLLFNGWSRVFPRTGQHWSLRFVVLTFCVFSLIISGMIILVPFTMSRLAHESILETLGGQDGHMGVGVVEHGKFHSLRHCHGRFYRKQNGNFSGRWERFGKITRKTA